MKKSNSDINDFKRLNSFNWKPILNRKLAHVMIELSKKYDADNESSEDLKGILDFFNIVKLRVSYGYAMELLSKWNILSESEQVSKSIEMVGYEMSSKMLLMMDSLIILKKHKDKNI